MQSKRELGWVLVGQLVAIIGGFLLIKVLTNLMTQADYGKLSLGLTVSGLISMFFYGPFAQGVTRYFSISKESEELSEYFNLIRSSHLKMGALVLMLSLLAFALITKIIGIDWGLLILVASIFGIVSGINLTFTSYQNAIRNREVVALHQGGDVLVRFMISAVVVLFVYSNSQMVMMSFILGTALVLCSQWGFAKRGKTFKSNWSPDPQDLERYREYVSRFKSYLHPFKYFAVFGAIGLFSDRWIIQWLYGEEEVGIYSALYLIANTPIMVVVGVVSQFIIPIVFDKAGDVSCPEKTEESGKLLYQAIFVVMILVLPMIFVSYYYGDYIVTILTNGSFADHADLLWILVISLTIFNIAQMLSLKGYSFNNPSVYIWPMAIKTVAFLLLAYFLAINYKLHGVVMAVGLSALTYLVMVIWTNKTRLKTI